MYSSLKQYLKEKLKGELPGFTSHSKMLPPGRTLKVAHNDLGLVKESGVLVLLFPVDGRLFTCLTRRPVTMTHHPGQISFPGGKVEPEDNSPEMTALREAKEEVGIESEQVEVLGRLSDLYVEVSKFSIHPLLAWSDIQPDFILNSNEVDELIEFPLVDFAENETILETQIQTSIGMLKVKYYPFNGKIIWGATAMILSELIDIVRDFYSERNVARSAMANQS